MKTDPDTLANAMNLTPAGYLVAALRECSDEERETVAKVLRRAQIAREVGSTGSVAGWMARAIRAERR